MFVSFEFMFICTVTGIVSCIISEYEIQMNTLMYDIYEKEGIEDLQEECPLGKLENPSIRNESLLSRQISQETSVAAPRTDSPSPPTVNSAMRATSGLQRARRSGRGLPIRAFRPCVADQALAMASARPIQPTFHSQNLRRMYCAAGGLGEPELVVVETVAFAGTRSHESRNIITAGAKRQTRMRVVVVTVSLVRG